jgi:hypothetical protein
MASGTMSGSGTIADPYLVEDALDLKAIESYGYDKYYEQTQDITLGTFEPIGFIALTTTNTFTGTYDGKGFSIKNGSITVTVNDYYSGIFANISGATIKDIVIDTVVLTGSVYSGLIAGKATNSTISDITLIDCTVSNAGGGFTTIYMGGVVGALDDVIVDGITIENITISTNAGRVGAVAGDMEDVSEIRNVQVDSDSTISATTTLGSYIGGIVGYKQDNTCLVEKCLNEATITSQGTYTGGIAGHNYKGSILNCHNKGSVTGVNLVGGITGHGGEAVSSVDYCLNEGNVAGRASVGGIIGSASSNTRVRYCYALNTTVTRTTDVATSFGRISGVTLGVYTSNYALDTMTMNT